MKSKKRLIVWIIVIAAAAAAVAMLVTKPGKKQSLSYEMATVSRTDISNFITATGTIEPVTEVEVGTQVSGIIDQIFVDYNSEVREGQVIALMDKVTLESEVASAQATYDGNKAEYIYQEKTFNRNKALYEKKLISDSEYVQSEYNYAMAKSAFHSSEAALAKAQRNLSYATITSPINGIVIDRSVEEGQTVAAGFETPTLFTLAADLTKMQVVADVDEADIGGVQEGQRASFTVDAYPDDTFEGTVTQIRLGSTSSSSSSVTSSTSESVVTYEVVITADNPELKLKPRLTANISIYTVDKKDVLSVPSSALKFYPEFPLITKDDIVNDCEGDMKIWTKNGNTFTAIPVNAGISDGVNTEITGGAEEGTVIVAGANLMKFSKKSSGGRSPFMPGPPDRKDNKKEEK